MVATRRDFATVGVFGSEILPPTSEIKSVSTISIPFLSEPDAIRELLPYHFDVGPDPVVRVGHYTYRGIDYLAGRGYNVLSVNVPAVYRGETELVGTYNVVLWEGSSHAVNLGRELQGYAKIYGEVPDAVAAAGCLTFECREFGRTLLRGEAHNLVERTPEQMDRLRKAAGQGFSLGWKYIPGPKLSSEPDCDYPTKASNPVFYARGWKAEGTVEFCSPSWEEAPVSTRILSKLRQLPIIEYRPAFIGEGTGSAPRSNLERLDA
jgi:acetoacetate decarboxylase